MPHQYPDQFQSPIEYPRLMLQYQQALVHELTCIRGTLAGNGLTLDKILHRLLQWEVKASPIPRESMPPGGAEKTSDPLPPSPETCHGENLQVVSMKGRTIESIGARGEETLFLLTSELAQHLVKFLRLLLHEKRMPASLVGEAKELIKFASAADVSKGSS